MAIVSSSYIAHGASSERRYVVERHTDSDGAVWPVYYWAEPNANLDTALATHAEALVIQLAESEIASVLGE